MEIYSIIRTIPAVLIAFTGSTDLSHASADSIKVAVEEIVIHDISMTPRFEEAEISNFVMVSLTLQEPLIIPSRRLPDVRHKSKVEYDFYLKGSGSVSASGFYISFSLENKQNKSIPITAIYGKPSEFYKKMEESLGTVAKNIVEDFNRKQLSKVIGFVTQRTLNNENELISENLASFMTDAIYGKLKETNAVTLKELEPVSDEALANPAALLRDRHVDCLIRVDLEQGDRKEIIVSPKLVISEYGKTIALPSVSVHAGADIELLKNSIKTDFFQMFDFILQKNGTWNIPNIRLMAMVASLPADSVFNMAVRSLDQDASFLSAYYTMDFIGKCREKADRSGEVRGYVLLGLNRMHQQRYAAAIYELSNAIRLKDDNTFLHMLTGAALLELPDYKKALTEFQIVAARDPEYEGGNLGDIKYNLGKTYYLLDSIPQAIQYLTASLAHGQENREVYLDKQYYLAVSLYKYGDYEKALDQLDAYLKTMPADEAVNQLKGDVYSEWGVDAYWNSNFTQALTHFKMAIRFNPNARNCVRAINAFNRLGHFDQADSLIRDRLKAGVFDPGMIYYDNAIILHDMFEEGVKDSILYARRAIHNLEIHLSKNSADGEATWLMGSTYVSLKDLSRGIRYLKEAVVLDDNNVGYKLDLAEAMIMAGRSREVAAVFGSDLTIYKSQPGDYAILLFLKYVANLVLIDAAQLTPEKNHAVQKELQDIFSTHERIVDNWVYDSFDEWLKGYTGAGKSRIEDATREMKLITVRPLDEEQP